MKAINKLNTTFRLQGFEEHSAPPQGSLRALRSARRLIYVLLSPLSFRFHDFVQRVELSANQCLLLRPAPAFDLSFPSQSIIVVLGFFLSPHELYRTTSVGIGRDFHSFLMLPQAFLDIICTPCIVGAIRAFQDVNNVRLTFLFLPEWSRGRIEG
jgi:hypothetical protein